MVMVPVLSSSRVCTSPAASTARPLMARTFFWTSRSMPAMPMAESRAPMVVGIRQTSRATRTTTETAAPGVVPKACERDDHGDEDDGEHGQQDGQGDLVGGLLPVGPLDQGDHAVEEGLAALGGDAHHDPVGEHPGAAGDGRAVASRLADDRGRLAGDGRFVDRGDALDDLAVGGDEVVGLADDDVPLGQLGRRHQRLGPVGVAGAAPRSPSASCAACRPAPCPAPRPWPRRSWRRSPSERARW